jgi:hypothetical protein
LLRKRDVLKDTLSSLQDILIEEGKASKDITATKFEQQKFLTKSLDEAKIRTSRKQDEVDKLNVTEPLQRLETTGTPSEQSDKWKYFHFTSNFYFNLSTTYPIRSVNYVNEKKSSKWKDQHYTYGGKILEAKLKNNPLRSAYARIELYGWPKEIHHEALVRKQKQLLERLMKQEDLQQKVVLGYSELEHLQSKNKEYGEAVEQCWRDLQKVESLTSLRSVTRSRLLQYAEADSIHGLAILLGLKSIVPENSSLILVGDKGPAMSLLNGRKKVFIKMQEYVKNVSSMVEEIAQQKKAREEQFQLTARLSLTTRLAYDKNDTDFHNAKWEIVATPTLGIDEEQRTLIKKGQEAVAKLQDDLQLFQSKKEALFAESREQRLAEFDCKQETKEARHELTLDWTTNQGVLSTFSAPKLPVGVVATLRVTPTASDAVARILRAERLAVTDTTTGGS